MSRLHAALALVLAAAPAAALAQATVPLDPAGTALNFTLPPGAVTNSIFVDVPASAERLTLRLSAPGGGDVDLLARYRSAFPAPVDPAQPDYYEWLFDHAAYLSVSPTGEESITLTRASRDPLRGERLFLSVANFENAEVPVSLTASLSAGTEFVPLQILFDDPGTSERPCDTSGWNDSTAATPVRGNGGTTLGQQRRNALQEATRLLSNELRPTAPVRVRACWDARDFNNGAGVLAFASALSLQLSERGLGIRGPFLARHNTVYTAAASAHQAGTQSCSFLGGSCSRADLVITFNRNVDQSAEMRHRFDYGFESTTSSTTGASFVGTAMHELAHGLGFLGYVNLQADRGPIGSKLTDIGGVFYDDIYSANARIIDEDEVSVLEFARVSDQRRADALVGNRFLRFGGTRATGSIRNSLGNFAAPFNMPQLHTPSEIAPGSTYSHLGIQHGQELMLASIVGELRTLGLGMDVLFDVGWNRAAAPVPTYALPPDAQYFDVNRQLHGIDFRRVGGFDDTYFLGFYSYDANGNPEWYTALGRVVDGIFLPAQNTSGDSLLRTTYREGDSPLVDTSPGFVGEVRIDFEQARLHPVCAEQAPSGQSPEGTLAVMTWVLPPATGQAAELRQWCMRPLVEGRAGIDVDFSGVWFDPTDPGWGITVQSVPGGAQGDLIALGVYFPDATGKGRWAVVDPTPYVAGGEYPVRMITNGYCRAPSCATPGQRAAVEIGSVRLTLRPPAEGGSSLSLDVTYPGTEGGRFVRTDRNIVPANQPGF